MYGNKNFDRIAVVCTALMLVVTILFMNGAALGIEVKAHTMGYETRLFDNTRVHTIDIVTDQWDELIANATSEEYYLANVVIDGEAYKNVGIRTKGNTSLSTVATLNSERYSFKIEFDHYDSSLTYYGLDKLSLNNLIQDSTMMKDYLTYTMMNEFGVNSSLCSYVYITVNGEDWGLYLAVEGVEEAFLERNYGSDYGELYKPDSLSFGGGRGNGKDFDINDFDFDFNNDLDSFVSGNFDSSLTTDGTMPDMSGGFDPSSISGGTMPDMSGGFDPSSMQSGTMPDMSGNFDPSSMQSGTMPDMSGGFDPSSITGGTMPDMSGNFDPSVTTEGTTSDIFGNVVPSLVMGGGFNGGGSFGMGSSDVKLQYIDDEIDSYSNIWDNAKTNITEADQKRLISSLKKLSENEDIENVVDIEQVIRYFVVHNYVCNDDSYTGMMVHNYYLYEKDGRLAMIPWDYNLGFGTFSGGSATSTVNTPIDTPVSGGSEDRPMLNWIFENTEYTELYHEYFEDFLNTVDIQKIIDDAYELIKSYVKKDPTAFYTYDEFETGVETLRQFCSMRSESISLQLENGQTVNNMQYVDASSITLSDMGSMNEGMDGAMDKPMGSDNLNGFDGIPSENGQMSDMFDPQNGTMTGNMFSGDLPDDFDPDNVPENFQGQMPDGDMSDDGQTSSGGQMPTMPDGDMSGDGQTSSGGQMPTMPDGDMSDDGQMQKPTGGNGFNINEPASSSDLSAWIWVAVSALVLVVGIVVAKKFRS